MLKRPGVDSFLERVARHYEVIVFTASLPQYANPLLDIVSSSRDGVSLFRPFSLRLLASPSRRPDGSIFGACSLPDRVFNLVGMMPASTASAGNPFVDAE